VGGGGEFPRSNNFYLSSLHVEEGESESAPCGRYPVVSRVYDPDPHELALI
jgi:hypothetical protein